MARALLAPLHAHPRRFRDDVPAMFSLSSLSIYENLLVRANFSPFEFRRSSARVNLALAKIATKSLVRMLHFAPKYRDRSRNRPLAADKSRSRSSIEISAINLAYSAALSRRRWMHYRRSLTASGNIAIMRQKLFGCPRVGGNPTAKGTERARRTQPLISSTAHALINEYSGEQFVRYLFVR